MNNNKLAKQTKTTNITNMNSERISLTMAPGGENHRGNQLIGRMPIKGEGFKYSDIDIMGEKIRKSMGDNVEVLNLNNLSYCSPGSLILPKKIYNKEKKRFLSFKENININFDIHNEKDPYELNNLSVVNNSNNEILNTIVEMEKLMLNEKDMEAKNLNDIFWQSISDNNLEKVNYLKNVLKLTISKNFLKENQNLF